MRGLSEKSNLRVQMRILRRRLAAATPDAAERLMAHLPACFHESPDLGVYSLYHPVGSEIDPRNIRLPTGESALPVAIALDAPLIFRLWRFGEPLVADAFGIPAPRADAPEVLPDVVFTPLLAFDRKGGRLGQGAGHYDRTLKALRAQKPVRVIGVAYAGQELPSLPLDAHDEPLDAILTETEYIRVG